MPDLKDIQAAVDTQVIMKLGLSFDKRSSVSISFVKKDFLLKALLNLKYRSGSFIVKNVG